METSSITHIVLQRRRPSSWYSEQETVVASHLGLGDIRRFRSLGWVKGDETGGELRYDEVEVAKLRRIRRLQHDLGVNLAGVEVILHLLQHMEMLQQELERERRRPNRGDLTMRALAEGKKSDE